MFPFLEVLRVIFIDGLTITTVAMAHVPNIGGIHYRPWLPSPYIKTSSLSTVIEEEFWSIRIFDFQNARLIRNDENDL